MRKIIALAAAGSTLALSATAFAATKSVTVGDDWFVRPSGVPTVTVKKGDTVVWRFRGDSPHNVVAQKAPSGATFRSPIKSSGTYKRKLTRTGTYTIICTIHGAANQKMVLKVR